MNTRSSVCPSVVAALLAAVSSAQSINIDVGKLWDGSPAPVYAAATGVAGTWNEVGSDSSGLQLVDTSGAPTNATISWPANGVDDGWPEIAGNNGKLMNDFQLIGGSFGASSHWTLSGLANGDYRVTFYSKPLEGQPTTLGAAQFTLLGGASGPQICDGSVAVPFVGFRYGVNMVQDSVSVSNGTLEWDLAVASGFVAHFNGMQIEAIVPGTAHTYCTAKPNSLGCTPTIAAVGTPSVSSGTFSVVASNVRSHRAGLLFWGTRQNGMPYPGTSAFLCVARPFTRTALQDSGGTPQVDDCSGSYAFVWSTSYLTNHGLSAGDTICCQYLATDEGALGGKSLTKGLIFVLAP